MSKQVDQAMEEVLRFPNYWAWRIFNPVALAMVGATDVQLRAAYEDALAAVLIKVATANDKAEGTKP